jgi:hypothetical protein
MPWRGAPPKALPPLPSMFSSAVRHQDENRTFPVWCKPSRPDSHHCLSGLRVGFVRDLDCQIVEFACNPLYVSSYALVWLVPLLFLKSIPFVITPCKVNSYSRIPVCRSRQVTGLHCSVDVYSCRNICFSLLGLLSALRTWILCYVLYITLRDRFVLGEINNSKFGGGEKIFKKMDFEYNAGGKFTDTRITRFLI